MYFDKILTLTPNDPLALQSKGNLLYDQHNYSGSLYYINKALNIDFNNYDDLWILKGKTLRNLHNYTGSLSYFNKVLEKNKNHGGALIGIGDVFYDQGNYTNAMYYYNRTLDIYPNDINALIGKGNVLS